MSGDTRVTIPSLARYLSRALVDFVYPPHCAACGTWLELAEDLLCPQCWRELETVGGRRCRRCGCPIGDATKTVAPNSSEADDAAGASAPHRETGYRKALSAPTPAAATAVGTCPNCRSWDPALERVLVWRPFDGVMQEAIHALKFNRNQRLGWELGRRLGASPRFHSSLAAIDMLVPVPLHPARQRERGYNQSLCIASGLAEAAGKPLRPGLVRRCRATRQQAKLDADERAQNLTGAFEAVEEVPGGIRIGLVDDVVTTGATLASCCKALEKREIASVWGVALASPYSRLSKQTFPGKL